MTKRFIENYTKKLNGEDDILSCTWVRTPDTLEVMIGGHSILTIHTDGQIQTDWHKLGEILDRPIWRLS